MAHPIRPSSYISINNFYTMTVYEKGAEVIRMIETILGRDAFRAGMDLYFKRHDGQAVTTEDFVAAMADATGVDLTQFKNWYNQSGTPLLKVNTHYDQKNAIFTVTLDQSCRQTPGQPEKLPYHIPVAIGLLGKDGRDLPLHLTPTTGTSQSPAPSLGSAGDSKTLVLHLRETKQSFIFKDINEKPVLSLLRGFSAPVRAEVDYTDQELAFLMAHDSDSFSRWEAAQQLTTRVVQTLVKDAQAGRPLSDPTHLVEAFGPLLTGAMRDPAFTAFMLSLPAEQYLAQFFNIVDIDSIHVAREHILRAIGRGHRNSFKQIYAELSIDPTNDIGPKAGGKRSLRATALEYITLSDELTDLELAVRQRREAKNMTDELSALSALNRTSSNLRQTAFDEFYKKWHQESLVMNKWLTLQAIAPGADALQRVKTLSESPIFDKTNPNKIYSLYIAFSKFNLVRFHERSGAAYRFVADQIIDIDSRNPQVAARLMAAFNQWQTMDLERQELMKMELRRILAKEGLSSNVFEIASKTLNAQS
jgi:aminopeptidase N